MVQPGSDPGIDRRVLKAELRGKDLRKRMATPLVGVLITIACIVIFLMWLGLLVILAKALMG